LGLYRVKALTTIEQFNETFGTGYSSEHADTLAGLLTDQLARLPVRGDVVELPPFRFEVLRADARQVHLLRVRKIEPVPENSDFDSPADTLDSDRPT